MDVTVIICTYNRAVRLARTLEYFSRLRPQGYAAEMVVVDNRSTDATAAIIRQAAAESEIPIRYAREDQQGKSFALNRALTIAQGDILALTDDDVLPGEGWLDRVVELFRARNIAFAAGKVLPIWEVQPRPEFLTRRAQDIWGPLALVDYGDEPFDYVAGAAGQRLPVGANLAFKRDVIVRAGGWRDDLGKVNNTLISGEDHEIFLRLMRLGDFRGVYDPALVVFHDVPAMRLTPKYFRRWFFAWGRSAARMFDDLYSFVDELGHVPYVAGIPRFMYRQALEQLWLWGRAALGRDKLERQVEELYAIRFAGLFWERWGWWMRQRGRRIDANGV
jgi:glycosyltransferase involved in cell wall biosynthesis